MAHSIIINRYLIDYAFNKRIHQRLYSQQINGLLNKTYYLQVGEKKKNNTRLLSRGLQLKKDRVYSVTTVIIIYWLDQALHLQDDRFLRTYHYVSPSIIDIYKYQKFSAQRLLGNMENTETAFVPIIILTVFVFNRDMDIHICRRRVITKSADTRRQSGHSIQPSVRRPAD